MSGLGDRLPPTPWRYDDSHGCVRDATGAAVAHVSWVHADTGPIRGRLLAAAPELYTALEALLGHSGLDVDAHDKDPDDHTLERAARAALANAVPKR